MRVLEQKSERKRRKNSIVDQIKGQNRKKVVIFLKNGKKREKCN
jgi:hypothetical protein